MATMLALISSLPFADLSLLVIVLPTLLVATGVATALYAYRRRKELWVQEYLGKTIVACYLLAMTIAALYYLTAGMPLLDDRLLPRSSTTTVAMALSHLLHLLGAYVVYRTSLLAANYLPKAGALSGEAASARALRATKPVLVLALGSATALLLLAPLQMDPKFDLSSWGHVYRLLIGLPCLFYMAFCAWLLIVARRRGRRAAPVERVVHGRYGWFAVAQASYALLWLNFLLWPLAADFLPSLTAAAAIPYSRLVEVPILFVMCGAHARGMTLPPDQGTSEALLGDHFRFDDLNDVILEAARRYDVEAPAAVPDWTVRNLVLRNCLEKLLYLPPRSDDFRLRLARRTISLIALVSPPEDHAGAWRERIVELASLRDRLSINDADDALLRSLDHAIRLTDEHAVRPLAHEQQWLQAAALTAAKVGLLPEPWGSPILQRRLLRPIVHDLYDHAEDDASPPSLSADPI